MKSNVNQRGHLKRCGIGGRKGQYHIQEKAGNLTPW